MEKIYHEHSIAVIVKYFGPTNTRGSRIKIRLPRWDNKSKWVPYTYDYSNGFDTVQAALDTVGIPATGRINLGDTDLLMVSYDHVDKVLEFFGIK